MITKEEEVIDAVFFQISTFIVTSFKVGDTGETFENKNSYLYMGVENFGVIIIDLNDYNRKLFVDIKSYIDWGTPVPDTIMIDSIGLIFTTLLNTTDLYDNFESYKSFSEIIGFSCAIKEIGSIAFEITPDIYVQDIQNDFISKGKSNVTVEWLLSFQQNMILTTTIMDGPTSISVFKDSVTHNNYLRVVEEDIALSSKFLLDFDLNDSSDCDTIGILNLDPEDNFERKTKRKNYCRQIGLICKHTLYFIKIDPYPTITLGMDKFEVNTNNKFEQVIEIKATNRDSVETRTMRFIYAIDSQPVGILNFVGFCFLFAIVFALAWRVCFMEQKEKKKKNHLA